MNKYWTRLVFQSPYDLASLTPNTASPSTPKGTSLAASFGAKTMARTARPSSAGMSPCAPPAITAADIATGSSSRPRPRARMRPRSPSGRGTW